MIQLERIRLLTPKHPQPQGSGGVVCWLQRDRRVQDNWALIHAQNIALERKVALHVVFCLAPSYQDATLRQYDFLIKGLQEFESTLGTMNIAFTVLLGTPPSVLPNWLQKFNPCCVITDIEPLRSKEHWTKTIAATSLCCIEQVDAHNVVPVWHASSKQEFGAYTLRPKINKLLPQFLVDFPKLRKHPFGEVGTTVNWKYVYKSLQIDTSLQPVSWIQPGEQSATAAASKFLSNIQSYATDRNNPTLNAQSNLSPYFHFGQLSPHRIALQTKEILTSARENTQSVLLASAESFFEELVIRRELADNFTFYNTLYDAFAGFHPWAQTTLNNHRSDKREYVYSLDAWEQASTHDELWNAAQIELVTTGKMHGYMRMYWAKKLLEWCATPEEALAIGIYLNDKYELDGRDPNGYTGLAWSIGGVHDRAWFERTVYGKVRYMNANGCAKKFDVKKYIRTHSQQQPLF